MINKHTDEHTRTDSFVFRIQFSAKMPPAPWFGVHLFAQNGSQYCASGRLNMRARVQQQLASYPLQRRARMAGSGMIT